MVRGPGALRSAAKASSTAIVSAVTAIAKRADSVLRDIARILVDLRSKPERAGLSSQKSLLENHADAVLLGPDDPAVANHAVLLGHQLEAGRHEDRIRNVDRRAL